jgi:predicted dienelactone hydrolase
MSHRSLPAYRLRPAFAAAVLTVAALLSAATPVAAQPATAQPATDQPATDQPSTAAATFPSVNGAWGDPGPYPTAVQVGLINTLYYPRDIASSTRRHPVIVWGNGTGGAPLVYRELLLHWASHGFIVSAANTPLSNPGISMRAGIDGLTRDNANPGSIFYRRVDLEHIGASGHSQGGAAAIVVGADRRIDVILPIQPGPLADIDSVRVPAFLMAGQDDSIVWPALVRAFYDDADHIPAIYGEVRDADHFTVVGDPGPFAAPTTAWFRFQLMGDLAARPEFYGPSCGICTDTSTWSDVRRNALVP